MVVKRAMVTPRFRGDAIAPSLFLWSERVTESNDGALTLRFLFPKCCGSSCSPAPPLPSSLASAVIALLMLWETEAGRSHDTAIQHLRHWPSLGPLLSSPQSETHQGNVQSLEGLALARVQIN